jgi:hypothetical protein
MQWTRKVHAVGVGLTVDGRPVRDHAPCRGCFGVPTQAKSPTCACACVQMQLQMHIQIQMQVQMQMQMQVHVCMRTY